MPRTVPYRVPNHILSDQALKVADFYEKDAPESRSKLESVGLSGLLFTRVRDLGLGIRELEHAQEVKKDDARRESAEAQAAIGALVAWRSERVLPRVAVAFDDDPRAIHFRPGQLRSRRAAAVSREARLLIAAIRRFADQPAAQAIGLTSALADEGEALLHQLEKEDSEAALAAAERMEATAALAEQVVELAERLADIEKRAAIAFDRGSAALRRYRMNVVREYVARQHRGGSSATDPTAGVSVEDPDPSAASDAALD